MNDEASFQAALDADPYDQNTRAAFADWLEDRNDPRAAAVRELWRMGWVPFLAPCDTWTTGAYNSDSLRDGNPDLSMLPQVWWERVRKSLASTGGVDQSEGTLYQWAFWNSRELCESAVIAAYQPNEVPT